MCITNAVVVRNTRRISKFLCPDREIDHARPS